MSLYGCKWRIRVDRRYSDSLVNYTCCTWGVAPPITEYVRDGARFGHPLALSSCGETSPALLARHVPNLGPPLSAGALDVTV